MDDDGASSGVKSTAPLDVSVFMDASIVVATEWGRTPSGGESSTRLERRDRTLFLPLFHAIAGGALFHGACSYVAVMDMMP